MAPPVGFWVDVVGAALMLLLGIGVAMVRPRRPGNVAFAVFAIALGTGFVVNNLAFELVAAPGLQLGLLVASGAILLVSAGGIAWTALRFPVPLRSSESKVWVLPALLAGVCWLPSLFFPRRLAAALVATTPGVPVEVVNAITWSGTAIALLHGGIWFALLVMARRYRLADAGTRTLREPVVLLSMAVVVYPAVFLGVNLSLFAPVRVMDPVVAWLFILPFVATAACVVFWLQATTGPGGRGARNMALFVPALTLTGLVAGLVADAGGLSSTGLYGAARTVGVAIAAYAIVQRQILGIDLRLKWTISTGTVASVFLLVFFVVGTVASEFLVDRLGFGIGGVVAGLLLFAIAPLQRFGDRVANAALPGVHDTPEYRARRKAEVYLTAYTGMRADGHVTEKEKDVLASLATSLGLDPSEVRAIERSATGSSSP